MATIPENFRDIFAKKASLTSRPSVATARRR